MIIQIDGFGGYMHFISTKKILDNIVQKGLYEKVKDDPFEIQYKCKACNTIWALAQPDFPVTGYLIQK